MPGQFPPVPPSQQKSGASKVLLIVLGVFGGLILLVVIGVVALGAFVAKQVDEVTPAVTEQTAKPVASSSVTNLTITDKVDDQSQAPQRALTTVPPATDRIYAAVKIDVKQGQVLSAKWYYNGNHQSHLDVELPVDEDFKGWASFDISNGGDPWPNGSYKVEVYLDAKKVAETPFSVK